MARWWGSYLGWTTENCHFVGQILAICQNRLLLRLSGLGINRIGIFWNSQELFLRPVQTKTCVIHANWDLEVFLSYDTSQIASDSSHTMGGDPPFIQAAIQSCALVTSQRISTKAEVDGWWSTSCRRVLLDHPRKSFFLMDLPTRRAFF